MCNPVTWIRLEMENMLLVCFWGQMWAC